MEVAVATGGRAPVGSIHLATAFDASDRPFLLTEYLAAASAERALRPQSVLVHHRRLPYGLYWSLLRPRVSLHRVEGEDPFAALRSAVSALGGVAIPGDRIWMGRPPGDAWPDPAAPPVGDWLLAPAVDPLRVTEAWVWRDRSPYARAARELLPPHGFF